MIIEIDTKLWTTPVKYAKEIKAKHPNVVRNWVQRNHIEYKRFEELDLTIVKRGSETVRAYARAVKKTKKTRKN